MEPERKKKRFNGWERQHEQESRVSALRFLFVTAGSEKEPAAGKPTQLAECSSTLCLGTPGRCARWAGVETRTGKAFEGSEFKYAVTLPPIHTLDNHTHACLFHSICTQAHTHTCTLNRHMHTYAYILHFNTWT